MATVPNGVETLPKISIAWVGRTNVTDRQTTDRRQTTDGPLYKLGEAVANNTPLRLTTSVVEEQFDAFVIARMQFQQHATGDISQRIYLSNCARPECSYTPLAFPYFWGACPPPSPWSIPMVKLCYKHIHCVHWIFCAIRLLSFREVQRNDKTTVRQTDRQTDRQTATPMTLRFAESLVHATYGSLKQFSVYKIDLLWPEHCGIKNNCQIHCVFYCYAISSFFLLHHSRLAPYHSQMTFK